METICLTHLQRFTTYARWRSNFTKGIVVARWALQRRYTHLEAHVKHVRVKELARFARENKINTYVTETIKLHDIDGNTAMMKNDDLGDMGSNSKLNKKKLIVALNLLKDVEVPASEDKSDDHSPIDLN